MTNDMREIETTAIATWPGRAITVAAGAAGSLLLWAVNVPWGGLDLAVHQGGQVQPIGAAAVVATALVAGLAAWGLLAVLERRARRPVRAFRIIALVVLLISLAGPLGGGAGLNSKLVLLGMHLTVGIALIAGLPGRRSCP
ncbi:DUF6069 family protein [Actinoplanes sp. CA-054009]